MRKISFNHIKSLFDDSWDVGVISSETLKRIALTPLKAKMHSNVNNNSRIYTDSIHYNNLVNTVILIKNGSTWDYTHYDEANHILENSEFKKDQEWFPIYTNFKDSAIFAGLGVRARNSLIYSYKFGFDMHICAIGFNNEIIDLPTNKRVNYKLWSRCNGCADCVNACPANAIHGVEEPYWLDSSACDNFIGYSDHPTIPSIKKFWHKYVHPEVSKHIMDQMKTQQDVDNFFGKALPFNNNGYTYDGNVTRHDGDIVVVPVCRECTSQPRCSKWGGKYPYEEFENIKPITLYKNKP